MKKTPRKLVLRSETLRTLDNLDLARAVGGSNSATFPCANILDTGKKDCEAAAAVVTAACG